MVLAFSEHASSSNSTC